MAERLSILILFAAGMLLLCGSGLPGGMAIP